MTGRSHRLLAALAIVLTFAVRAFAALPEHAGYVTDLASVLDDATKAQLTALLSGIEQETTAEVAVVTVTSLEGTTVEDYANRLFKQWGIGKKGKDNGVLILVAPGERKIRIEVGYGIEPVLPDGLAGNIIRNQALPEFRKGDFAGGIMAVVESVSIILQANHPLTAGERQALGSDFGHPSTFATTAFFGMFIVLGALSLGVGLRTKTIFPSIWGALFGGIPFVLALIPFFNASLKILVPAALATFAFGWVKGGSERWRNITRASKKGRRGKGGGPDSGSSSGWVMGNSSPSSSDNSSSSSSSFGGGRSGGGGASGSW
jgi:uncharacterized protein